LNVALRALLTALAAGIALPAFVVLALRGGSAAPSLPITRGVLPEFSLEDQQGRLVTSSELRRSPVVVSFFFTTCTSICPISAAHLVRLQQAIAAEDVAFVSFSIDPDRDDPSARRAYARRWAPNEQRWHLLAPTTETLISISAGLGLDARTEADLHTTAIVLLAPGGQVFRIWSAETALADEVAAVYLLTRRQDVTTVEDGPTLYSRYGCAGCHEDSAIAPDLRAGGPYTVDQVRSALVSPSAELARGFRDTMPSYGDSLTELQLTVLSAWLSVPSPSLARGPSMTPSELGPTAVDPVCGMKVHPTDRTPHTWTAGVDHWFCSNACRRAYAIDPTRYDQ
jgi:protein SCO1/2